MDLIPSFCCVCLNIGHESLDCYEFSNLPEHQKGQICAMQAFRDMQHQNQPSSSSFQPKPPFQQSYGQSTYRPANTYSIQNFGNQSYGGFNNQHGQGDNQGGYGNNQNTSGHNNQYENSQQNQGGFNRWSRNPQATQDQPQ